MELIAEVPVPKSIKEQVEELHALLPAEFKDFMRQIAEVPKVEISEASGKKASLGKITRKTTKKQKGQAKPG